MDVIRAASCKLALEANGPQANGCNPNQPNGVHKVAQEFESLLIGEILKSMKSGSLTPDGKDADDSVMQYAQESLARTMSQSGGLGLANMIEQGLIQRTREAAQATVAPASYAPRQTGIRPT